MFHKEDPEKIIKVQTIECKRKKKKPANHILIIEIYEEHLKVSILK